MKRYFYVFFFGINFLLAGCSKQSAKISLPALTDYYPLQTGRVLIYRLDSSLIPLFGTDLQIKSYLAKDSIADTIRDNQQRLSYRVYRFITDTLNVEPWAPIGTYYITPAGNSVEVVDENNLRFIKLKEPVRNDFHWQGNSYIDTKSAGSIYQYLDGWNYVYQNVDQPYTVIKGTLDSTITVLQQDETSPPGPFDPNNFQQRNYAIEVYARGIGLIYKEFLHSTWQTTPPPAHFENDSYGIKLRLIDYK
ncbi:MAG TPA: hypothetical protein VH396_02600 [Chitinophagaceae bacterium]|jgi:hypothetical protein